MGFRFPLSTVLRIRESIENREEIALKAIQQETARLRRTIGELNLHITEGYQELEKVMQHPLKAREMQMILGELERAGTKRQDLLLELEVSLHKQREQLRTYRAAVRGRQTLSEMLAQKRAEYAQKQERIQQRFLDDVFAARSKNR